MLITQNKSKHSATVHIVGSFNTQEVLVTFVADGDTHVLFSDDPQRKYYIETMINADSVVPYSTHNFKKIEDSSVWEKYHEELISMGFLPENST